jgi:hypothetical protein
MDTELLLALMERKCEVLTQLCALGRRQLALIEENNIADLLDVFEAKRQLVAQLHETQRQLVPFSQQSPESRVWQSPLHRDRCARFIERGDALLAEVFQQEHRGMEQLRELRDAAAHRLNSVHRATAAEAYARDEARSHRHLDLSCEA